MSAFDKNAERVPCYVCDGTGQSSEHDRCDPPNYYECGPDRRRCGLLAGGRDVINTEASPNDH